MAAVLATNWWALALRGAASILFGLLAFAIPGVTLAVIVWIFGAYALVDGILAIVAAVRAARGHQRWGAFVLEGAVGLAAGLITLFVPGLTLFFLVYMVGAWAIMTGVFEIAAAIRLRKHISGEFLLGLMGVLSIAFGIMIFAAPIAGAIVIAWWLGAYALIFGVLVLALAFRLRSMKGTLLAGERPSASAAGV